MLSGNTRFCAILSQAVAISYESLLISLVIVFVSAAVIAIQVSKQFLMTGAEAYVGGSIAIVLIREIAPGFVALAIGARAGTAISAEIANSSIYALPYAEKPEVSVSVNDSAMGSLTAEGDGVNSDIVLNAVPADGHVLASLTVNGKEVMNMMAEATT